MATAYDLTKGNQPLPMGVPQVISQEIDLVGKVLNDTVKVFTIPKNTVVLAVSTTVLTACSVASSTMHLGITGGDVDGYDASVPLDAAAGTVLFGDGALLRGATDTAALEPAFYNAASSIDAIFPVMASTPTAGKIKVNALICVMG